METDRTSRLDAVPRELRDLPRWIVWRYEDRGQRRKLKVPYDPVALTPARVNDATTCGTFASAKLAFDGDARFDGVGFVFAEGTGYVGIDLDHCRSAETGEIDAVALAQVERLASYSEISPSGTGIHVIARGCLADGGRKRGDREMYDRGRYFTITGDVLPGHQELADRQDVIDALYTEWFGAVRKSEDAPGVRHAASQVEPDEAVLKRVASGDDGEKFARLMANDWTREFPSQSEADLAFCSILARYTQCAEQIDRIMRSSPLLRKKWDSRRGQTTYGQQTITRALELGDTFELDGKSKPVATSFKNVRVALGKLSVELWYDDLSDTIWTTTGTVIDDDVIRWRRQIQEAYKFTPTTAFMHEAVRDCARRDVRNPVRAYLDSLVWDQTPRLGYWLTDYAGAESCAYTAAVGQLLLVSAVRRVRRPGVKSDCVVILEGAQGIGKSSLLRLLAVRDEWFADNVRLGGDDKEFIEDTLGKWIVESSELTSMRRTDSDMLKARLSRQVDRARMAYAHITTQRPRQCILVGTTNTSDYLSDLTGNRRFLPVACTAIDLDSLASVRDQLWAEAADWEARHPVAPLELPRGLWAEAAAQADARVEIDPWADQLADELADRRGKVRAIDLYTFLEIQIDRRTQHVARRISAIMRRLGWTYKVKRFGEATYHAWCRGDITEEAQTIVAVRRGDAAIGNQYVLCYQDDNMM